MILSVAILAQVIERSIHLPIRTRVAHQQWRRKASIRGGGNSHVMKTAQALTVKKSAKTYRRGKERTCEEAHIRGGEYAHVMTSAKTYRG